MKVQLVKTWAANIEDKPGALADKLEKLTTAGANLEFILARRAPDAPGTAIAFVCPIRGTKQTAAAKEAGFTETQNLFAVRVETTAQPGAVTKMTKALAAEGLNLRGLSAIVFGLSLIHI
ncbi:MAG: amino acid-binding protein, partial [Verrucomicrobiae bacterium]|nr:amino acid-binding protein [Verrucomicrobiae bacterium]